MEKNFKSWFIGVFKNLEYPEIPTFELIRSSESQWPQRNAIIFVGMEMIYAELGQQSDKFAAALTDLGVGMKGKRGGRRPC